MKTKKILCLILTLVFIFCLCSCRESAADKSGSSIVESIIPDIESVIDNTVADDTVSVESSETEDTATSVVEPSKENDESTIPSEETNLEIAVSEMDASLQAAQGVISTASEITTVPSVSSYTTPPERIPVTVFDDIPSYISWLNNGGDDKAGNQLFLKSAKAMKKVVTVTPKAAVSDRLNLEIITFHAKMDRSVYLFYDKLEDNYFRVELQPNIGEYKGLSLSQYKSSSASKIEEGTALQQTTRNNREYLYTDYVLKENGDLYIFSRAEFFYDDFIVVIYDHGHVNQKPFNHECLDWFEFEVVDIDI